MTVIERELDGGAALYDEADPSVPLAIREHRSRFTTLLWSSQYGVSQALGAFKSITNGADPATGTELTFVASNGYSQRTVEDVPAWIDKLQGGPEAVSKLRIECVIPGIGAVALGFNRSVPGMNLAESAVSVTAPTVNHACIRALFESSAVPEVAESSETFVVDVVTENINA